MDSKARRLVNAQEMELTEAVLKDEELGHVGDIYAIQLLRLLDGAEDTLQPHT